MYSDARREHRPVFEKDLTEPELPLANSLSRLFLPNGKLFDLSTNSITQDPSSPQSEIGASALRWSGLALAYLYQMRWKFEEEKQKRKKFHTGRELKVDEPDTGKGDSLPPYLMLVSTRPYPSYDNKGKESESLYFISYFPFFIFLIFFIQSRYSKLIIWRSFLVVSLFPYALSLTQKDELIL